jgi:hypothetical protein
MVEEAKLDYTVNGKPITFKLRELTMGEYVVALKTSGMKVDITTGKPMGSDEQFFEFMVQQLQRSMIEPIAYQEKAELLRLPKSVFLSLLEKANELSSVAPL